MLVATLTQLVLQVAVLVVFNVFVLAEEVLVDVSPSEQPHIRVVCDGPVCVVGPVQSCALSLGLRRRHQERHAEQPQQLLEPTRETVETTHVGTFLLFASLFNDADAASHPEIPSAFISIKPAQGVSGDQAHQRVYIKWHV